MRRWLGQGLLSGRLWWSSCPPWEWPLRDRWCGQVTLASHWSILLILSSHWSAGDMAAPMRDIPESTPGQWRENTYCKQNIEKILFSGQHSGRTGSLPTQREPRRALAVTQHNYWLWRIVRKCVFPIFILRHNIIWTETKVLFFTSFHQLNILNCLWQRKLSSINTSLWYQP